ncbi:MAG: hypothetical protein ACP5KN_13700 [Armatimonadota bacterium]
MYRKAMLCVTLLAVACWLTSCSGGSGGGDGDNGGNGGMDPSTPLIGFWQPIDATHNDSIVPVGTALDWNATWTNATYRFNQNGSVVVRAYEGATEAETLNGQWQTDQGAGDMTVGGTRYTIVNSSSWANVASLTLRYEGNTYAVRMARIIDLSEHDPAATRTWLMQSVQVDGVAQPVNTFFGLQPDSDGLTLQLLPDGTGITRELTGEFVVDRDTGTWVTGGATAIGNVPEPLGWVHRAIYQPGGLLVVTFLDTAGGGSVRLELSRWAPDDTRDPALVGLWRATGATRDGEAVDLSEVFDGTATMTDYFVELWSDGTMEIRKMAGASIESAELNWWWTRPGQLFTDSLDPEPNMMMNYTLTGSALTISFSEEGHEFTIELAKQ